MDWVEPKTNREFDRIIRDWISQYLNEKEPDRAYREGLLMVLQVLWPSPVEGIGERERPSYFPLPSLCGQALGRRTLSTTAANAAWVLLFTASYLLDKIEDREVNHPIFKTFSQGTAANLATGLILHAERILAELEPAGWTEGAILDEVRRAFNQKALEVCAGQHLDLTLKEPTFSQGWEIVDGKSGKFFSLAAYLGARLATSDAASLQVFSKVGRYLGILVQVANDIHGLGKDADTGSDLALGRRTLPVLYALQVLPAEERARLVEHLQAAPSQAAAEVEARRIIISAGVIVYLSLEAEKYRQMAVSALASLKLDADLTQPIIDLLNFTSHPKTTLRFQIG